MKRVAVLGLGAMGSKIAKRLVEAGLEVTVFNRTPEKADALVAMGAKRARTASDAASSAEIMITMGKDDEALKALLFGDLGALKSLPKNAIHISMSTISTRLAEELTEVHVRGQTRFVAAPVFGRPPAAAEGKLFILAGGDPQTLGECEAVFGILGQKTVHVGETPKSAHLTKILGNFMLFAAIEALAEAIAHAKTSGLGEQVFLDAMISTIFSAPFYKVYGLIMVDNNYTQPAGVSVRLALKDIRLALQSADDEHAALPTASLIHDQLLAAIGRGYGDLEVSSLAMLAKLNAGLK